MHSVLLYYNAYVPVIYCNQHFTLLPNLIFIFYIQETETLPHDYKF